MTPGDDFYRHIIDVLNRAQIEFLVGGAFAMRVHAGISRDTKDFDVMLRPRDVERTLEVCRDAGFRADYAYSHWIAKVHFGEHFIDLIYRAGNGLCEVDDAWFHTAKPAEVLGRVLRLCPPEELIWQKAYVMERERFDGADVMHLLRSTASTLDWPRLIARFGADWRILLSHLVLFGYIYPEHREDIPQGVLDQLIDRLTAEAVPLSKSDSPLCRGTLVSRGQYLPDVERWGYRDARLEPRVRMSTREILAWTTAIDRVNRLR